jgi:hypothetical protein
VQHYSNKPYLIPAGGKKQNKYQNWLCGTHDMHTAGHELIDNYDLAGLNTTPQAMPYAESINLCLPCTHVAATLIVTAAAIMALVGVPAGKKLLKDPRPAKERTQGGSGVLRHPQHHQLVLDVEA